jgi:anti-anti-sigma factor
MDISEEKRDGIKIIFLNGRLDATNSGTLQEKFLHLAAEEKSLLVNCAGLAFISSSGLRIFMLVAKKMKSERGHFGLCNLNENIQEIFELSGLTEVFPIYLDESAALEAMKILS